MSLRSFGERSRFQSRPGSSSRRAASRNETTSACHLRKTSVALAARPSRQAAGSCPVAFAISRRRFCSGVTLPKMSENLLRVLVVALAGDAAGPRPLNKQVVFVGDVLAVAERGDADHLAQRLGNVCGGVAHGGVAQLVRDDAGQLVLVDDEGHQL